GARPMSNCQNGRAERLDLAGNPVEKILNPCNQSVATIYVCQLDNPKKILKAENCQFTARF
ncbi:MAG TPA: hypothetical protein VMD27_05180, partial [Candidatus Aquilonibacter sp.]|nr:hypothetical protein [Candidatus Aquilonibacter sp.]